MSVPWSRLDVARVWHAGMVLGGNRGATVRRLRAVTMTVVRYSAAATFVAAAGLLASCGVAHARATPGGRPWWSQSGACAPPALVRVDGHVMGVGDCAGALTIHADKVTLDVGQLIDVHMLEEGTGPSGNRVVPIFPLPRSSRASVVTPIAISADRATGTYRAVHPGQAALMSRTRACLVSHHRKSRKATGSCPVVEITVVP